MAKISRDRGAAFEREVANLFKDWGHMAFRTAQHMGKTGQAPDVKAKYLHIECKRRRNIAVYEWYEQARADALAEGKGNLPTVIFRGDKKPPMVMMHFEDWMKLYNEYRSARELLEKWGIEQ
jgi:Holliday junction resolvase